jgi:lysophospholipase L1-like esterase
MNRLLFFVAVLAALVFASGARADADSATHYYLSLGDSLAAGSWRGGDLDDYPEQLFAELRQTDPKLELDRLGCGGESTTSMRFGSQLPSVVLSCGTPRDYKNFLFSKRTQLAEAVSFLEAHKGKVALVTIDIGANDLSRVDAQGNLISCLFEPQGCGAQVASMQANLTATLAELRAAAGEGVPIVGMTYYDVFAPLCVSNPSFLFVCSRVDAANATIAATYDAAGVPVADVAGAFENDDVPSAAANVCAWTRFCSSGFEDVHPNATGYGVIAQAFLDALQP